MVKPAGIERRKSPRLTPRNARVWCVTGEYEELYTTVNFAKRLVNLGLRGACVETSGRLRPDLKMSVEVRFDDLKGSLRSQAKIVWVETANEKGVETHTAGLWFQGDLEITQPVRQFMEGGSVTEIRGRRQAEYEDLKRKALTPPTARRKRGVGRTLAAVLALLVFAYVASYGGWILHGSIGEPGGPLTYRFLSADPGSRRAEEALAKFYSPLYWLFRKSGLHLVYSPR